MNSGNVCDTIQCFVYVFVTWC